jgi:hypothetical protein
MHKFCLVSALAFLASTLGSPRLGAETFHEDFSANPLEGGWSVAGSAHLFEWDAAAQNLRVTWDSSQPNSFFHRPLGTTLSRADDFSFSFQLRMESIAIGVTPEKPFTFQIAAGFLNVAEAVSSNYFRATGFNSPNLVEFNYFPDSGFGATIAPIMISTNHDFAARFNFPFELTLDDLFEIEMSYRAATRTLTTTMTRNGEPFGPMAPVTLPENFTDFAVPDFAISSYSDEGQLPDQGGSILARGMVDDLRIVLSAPPLGRISAARVESGWRVRFATRAGWTYTLERTGDFEAWIPVGTPAEGSDEEMALIDPTPSPEAAFYRVKASRE